MERKDTPNPAYATIEKLLAVDVVLRPPGGWKTPENLLCSRRSRRPISPAAMALLRPQRTRSATRAAPLRRRPAQGAAPAPEKLYLNGNPASGAAKQAVQDALENRKGSG